jgi:hypothetical protein
MKMTLTIQISGDGSMSHAYPIPGYDHLKPFYDTTPVLQATGESSDSVQPSRTARSGTVASLLLQARRRFM